MSRPAVLVAVVALVLGYVPETGLDHLHLHVKNGHEFVHDHLHVGLHEHGQPGPAAPADTHDDHGETPGRRSAMVSYAQAAQQRPPSVEVAQVAIPADEAPWFGVHQGGRSAEVHRPSNPRAPPT